MSAWPDKFVIGLTGNIATGKSVVRRMLEHVGAFGIDADALSNRAIQIGAPGYQAVIDVFGRFIVKDDGQIDRSRLGQLVFSDPEALLMLESILHPLVREAVDVLVRKNKNRVVVIEAIKLLESPLRQACDVIWVTTSESSRQLSRLQNFRGMIREEAELRMAAQSGQEEKIAQADTVIFNNSSIASTWEQVRAAWKLLFPEPDKGSLSTQETRKLNANSLNGPSVLRARPGQAGIIADFISNHQEEEVISQEEIMDSFGEQAYLLLEVDEKLVGLLAWKVENLVARVEDIVFDTDYSFDEGLPILMAEVERASSELQCEAALIFAEGALAERQEFWTELGYQAREIQDLDAGAWQEAAIESFRKESVMFFKQLRNDRVLRPF
jgi:dephospho-CoA kinase